MSIEIGLQVCIGTISVSLEELADLQTGECFEVGWRPEQTVVISLGEERLAEARLVTDGDALYAEVVRLFE